jgi:NADH-quinone oxidoreductase subunit E
MPRRSQVGATSAGRGSTEGFEPGATHDAGHTDPWQDIKCGLGGSRSDLVPALQRAQGAFGYLSEETLRHIARWLKLSESEVFGVASFYGQFRFSPPGRHRVRVCVGTACHVKGGVQMLESVERRFGVGAGETTPDGEYDVERVACLGCCALAPVLTLDEVVYGQMSVLKLKETLDEREDDRAPTASS